LEKPDDAKPGYDYTVFSKEYSSTAKVEDMWAIDGPPDTDTTRNITVVSKT